MADRYWVGGSGTWNTTNTANWSDTSGGTGGASVPTGVDDVFFDAASTVTLGSDVTCRDITIENVASLDFVSGTNSITVFGNCEVNKDVELYKIKMSSTVIKTAYFVSMIGFATGNIIRLDVLQGCKATLTMPTEATSGFITIEESGYLQTSAGLNNTTIKNGATLAFLTGSKVKSIAGGGNITITGTIYPSSTYSSLNLATLSGNPTINTTHSSYTTLSGNGTISIQVDNAGTTTQSISFAPSSAFKIQTFNVDGNATRNVTINSSVSGTRAQISYLGTAKTISYVNVKDIHLVEDDKIISYTTNSTNLGNNWQWYFDAFTKPIRNLFYGSHI